MSSKLVVATRYYDEDLFTRFGLLDDIHWSFALGGMGQFLDIRDHTYGDLTLEFLNTLYVEVTSGSCCQEGYISFCLNREFYELNLHAFNSIFGFPPSMELPYRHVPKDFNPNAFWNQISGEYQYDTGNSKGTIIRNPYI